MLVGKINSYSNNTRTYNSAPTFERRLKRSEEKDYNENAIKAALDFLGIQSVAMVLHGSCNPVTTNDMGIGSPCNEKTKEMLAFEQLHGFNANQLGPMGEVTRGDISPYSATVFSYNKLFIDVNALATDEYANILPTSRLRTYRIDYSEDKEPYTYSKFFDAFENYDKIIKEAYGNFKKKLKAKDPNALRLYDEYNKFKAKKGNKAIQSALFEVLSKTYGTRDISCWESEIDRNLPTLLRHRDLQAINRYRQIMERSSDDINSYVFGQFLINKQLKENKDFRDSIGFEYINDNLVGNDNSEVWMYPDVFLKDYRLGCPDGGKDNGPQLWEIPVLDPKKFFNADGTLGPAGRFLQEKLESALEYCENLRIDHALGLVDPYLYDKNSILIIDGHLDKDRFRGDFVSKLWEVDPNHSYEQVLEKIVLPVLEKHGIAPQKAVWEDLGNQTETFRNIYHNKLHIPGMTQLHWDRGENASRDNWALMGSHDEETAISLIKHDWLTENWDKDNSAWHIDYLAGYLNQDPARVQERAIFKQKLLNNPVERVKAKFAELFTTSSRVQIPFTDFFGIEARYNEKGTKSATNWKLRLNNNYQDEYYKNLESNSPTAINMPEVLRIAVQAKMDKQVVEYTAKYATKSDGSVDSNKVSDYRLQLNKKMNPLLAKLSQYERILKEKEQ